jgi:hypothetical protein
MCILPHHVMLHMLIIHIYAHAPYLGMLLCTLTHIHTLRTYTYISTLTLFVYMHIFTYLHCSCIHICSYTPLTRTDERIQTLTSLLQVYTFTNSYLLYKYTHLHAHLIYTHISIHMLLSFLSVNPVSIYIYIQVYTQAYSSWYISILSHFISIYICTFTPFSSLLYTYACTQISSLTHACNIPTHTLSFIYVYMCRGSSFILLSQAHMFWLLSQDSLYIYS